MKTQSKKLKSYEVQTVMHIMVTKSIMAKDIDEAVAVSKDLRESDFIDIQGDYIDGNFSITGVYESAPSGL